MFNKSRRAPVRAAPCGVVRGLYRIDDIELEIGGKVTERYTYVDADYGSLTGCCERILAQALNRGRDWQFISTAPTREPRRIC